MSSRFIHGAIASTSKLRNIASTSNSFHASTSALLRPSLRFLSSDAVSHDTTSADSDIKHGHIHGFDPKKRFGFIRPNGVSRTAKLDQMVFFHLNDIETPSDVEGPINPAFPLNESIQYKIDSTSPERGTSLKARDVTLEGGKLFPPFHEEHIEKFIKVQKAKFGDSMYDIMDSATMESEMEKKIVEAYEKCVDSIEKEKRRVQKITELYERETSL